LVGDAIQFLSMIAKKTKSAVGDCSKGRRN
jgi:hypothetical protein